MANLFTPVQIGKLRIKHRVVLSPLSRRRADEDGVPLTFSKDYYAQRASVPGTLLITESTFISPASSGLTNSPGIYTNDQQQAWKSIASAVHAKGSFIFMQLWAMGRAGNPGALSAVGHEVTSSSAIPISSGGVTPRPLTEDEIHQLIDDFAQAARNAIDIGFDGIELNAANGYLIDQFNQEVTNNRTDKWGGSIENRARFGLEVAKAVVKAIGADRVGIRLSPWAQFLGMGVADPVPQFSYFVEGLKPLNMAYLHLIEARILGNTDVEQRGTLDFLTDIWPKSSALILNGGYTAELAEEAVGQKFKGRNIAISFGRQFISNPDLPFRLQNGIPLAPYDRDTFYVPKLRAGYDDYPFSAEYVNRDL